MRVELLGEDGGVIASASDKLPPHAPRRVASGRAPTTFVVKFPLEEVQDAARIRLKVTQRGQEP